MVGTEKNSVSSTLAGRSDKPKPFAYWKVMTLYERFEHLVVLILSFMISIIILFALLQVIKEVFQILILGALDPMDHKVFQVIFGMVMTLLIALEFKHSILKVLERQAHIVQARSILLIALLALSRKFIIIDLAATEPSKLLALAGATLVLGVVYYLIGCIDDKPQASE